MTFIIGSSFACIHNDLLASKGSEIVIDIFDLGNIFEPSPFIFWGKFLKLHPSFYSH